MNQMRIRIPPPRRMIAAENTMDPVEIAVSESRPLFESVLKLERIERLFILSPAGVSDKTLVVEHQTLTSDSGRKVVLLKMKKRLVEFGCFGIADCGFIWLIVQSGLIVGFSIECPDVFEFDHGEKRKLPVCRISDRRSKSRRVRGFQIALFSKFVARPEFQAEISIENNSFEKRGSISA